MSKFLTAFVADEHDETECKACEHPILAGDWLYEAPPIYRDASGMSCPQENAVSQEPRRFCSPLCAENSIGSGVGRSVTYLGRLRR